MNVASKTQSLVIAVSALCLFLLLHACGESTKPQSGAVEPVKPVEPNFTPKQLSGAYINHRYYEVLRQTRSPHKANRWLAEHGMSSLLIAGPQDSCIKLTRISGARAQLEYRICAADWIDPVRVDVDSSDILAMFEPVEYAFDLGAGDTLFSGTLQRALTLKTANSSEMFAPLEQTEGMNSEEILQQMICLATVAGDYENSSGNTVTLTGNGKATWLGQSGTFELLLSSDVNKGDVMRLTVQDREELLYFTSLPDSLVLYASTLQDDGGLTKTNKVVQRLRRVK